MPTLLQCSFKTSILTGAAIWSTSAKLDCLMASEMLPLTIQSVPSEWPHQAQHLLLKSKRVRVLHQQPEM
ncbi:hypothetical protein Q5H92_00150 [Hymenobacter sp. M29]|uniref:Uncharacterized protein n=1 Tax=Hymenobacter mellowenesis TaxID=3063995 RepID=A0ABT9A4I6_9BACT|nr:hypothetical protein [Hymenobacter sp. M29]